MNNKFEFKGTKGTFHISHNDFNSCINRKEDFEDGRRLSIDFRLYDTNSKDVSDISNTDESKYNAQLLFKAPEMFEMLKSILALQQEKYGNGSGLHLAMIGKAKEIESLLKDATTI